MAGPYNPGAATITAVSNAEPMQITTAAANNFTNGQVIVLTIPKVNGLLPPNFNNDPSIPNQIFTMPIAVVNATNFTMPMETVNYTPYVNNQPAYAVPVTYICFAQTNPTYQPAYRLVTAITNGFPCVVTTSFAHNFYSKTVVRLQIPPATGMPQIDQQTGTITVLSPTTFSIPIDTTNLNAFSIPTVSQSSDPRVNICALVVPIGEDNSILYASTQNALPYTV